MTTTTAPTKTEKQTPFPKKAKSKAAANDILPQPPRSRSAAKKSSSKTSSKISQELLSDWSHAS